MAVTGQAPSVVVRDEVSLIARVRNGDSDVFLELIEPYERSLFHLANSVLKNAADAEETVQEAILKAFRNLGQLRSESTFKSWLFQIVMNEARMRRRKDRAHLYESLDEGEQDTEEGDFMPRQIADWREVPSEALERTELRKQLTLALEKLPPKLRETFVLRDVQHLSEREAAEVLGTTVSTVKMRLHRARLMLREELAPIFKKSWTDRLPFIKGVRPW